MRKSSWVAAVLFGAIMLTARSGAGREKDLARVEDPVVIELSELGRLAGASPQSLSLLAWKDQAWSPIPFQVDQKKPDGSYAFTAGPEAGPDPDPNLDGNDELVFLVKDAGGSFEAGTGSWPAGAREGLEFEVTDPKDGSRAWAYLFSFEGAAPVSEVDYIHLEIDSAKNTRLGGSDRLTVGAPLDRVYPDLIAQNDPATGNPGKDVLDRLKIRGELVFPGGIKIPINVDDLIKCRDTGYIDGPVRVLHRAWGFMEVAGIEFKGFGYSTLTYYPNHMIVPVTIEAADQVPDWLIKMLLDGRIAGYMDFNSNVYGSLVFNAANPPNPEVVLDGKTSAAETDLDRKTEINWIAGAGPEGGLVVRLILSEKAAKQAKLTTYFVDDQTGTDPPEDHAGVSAAGFEITGRDHELGELIRSETFYVYAYAKRDLRPDNVHTLLDILDYPLQTRTAALDLNTK